MPIIITYRQIIIGILLLVLSFSSLATEPNNLIKDITFSHGDKGEGIVTISLPNSAISSNVQEKAGKVIINLPNTTLPNSLQKEINLAESKTPIQRISPISQNKNTIINILPIGNFNYSATQLDNLFIITLWNRPEQSKAKTESSDYISLNFHDTEITTILKTLADYNKKIKLISTDDISGKMTLRTQNMTWEQVLDVVLKANYLAKRLEGNVLIISSKKELSGLSRRRICQEGDNLRGNLRREILTPNYIDVKTVAEIFKQRKPEAEQRAKGSFTIDKRTNTIIAYQTPENIELLKKIIKELDISIPQVQLDSRVVEVNKSYITFIKNQFNKGEDIDLLLNKMQKEDLGEVISQPKITTSDKEQVRIMKGLENLCHTVRSCHNSSQPALNFSATPEIINDSQIKLSMELFFEKMENQNKSSSLKKQFEKIVNNNQTIILDKFDDLDDLGYLKKNDPQSQLMIIITSKIVE